MIPLAKTDRTPRTPKVHVVLDTNALFTDAADKLLSAEISALITEETKPLGLDITWYIPASVKAERRHQMLERGKGLLIPLGKLEALLGHNLAMSADILSLRVDEAISRQIKAHNLEELALTTDQVDWPQIIDRAVTKRPPFSTGSEKGFKDALILEAFLQLAGRSPKTPASCRIAFLTNDALLQEAARERTAHMPNVSVIGDIGGLKTLLNAIAAHLSQDAIQEIIPKASLLFWDFETKDGIYIKHDIYRKITSSEYFSVVDSKPDSYTTVRNANVNVFTPTFIEKQGQRVAFSSQVSIFTIAKKILPTQVGSGLLNLLHSTPEFEKAGSTNNALTERLGNYTIGQSTKTRKGSHTFSVAWEATLNQRGQLTNPTVRGISHQSSSWGDEETSSE
jgi:hypothetical protein